MVDFLDLDYEVRDITEVRGRPLGMGYLMQQPREDDTRKQPNLYLVEGPRMLLGDGAGPSLRSRCPGSAADDCEPDLVSTTCSLEDFSYEKIANSDSRRPAARRTPSSTTTGSTAEDIATLMELVELSGYDVGPGRRGVVAQHPRRSVEALAGMTSQRFRVVRSALPRGCVCVRC